jgi:hypothetical protein
MIAGRISMPTGSARLDTTIVRALVDVANVDCRCLWDDLSPARTVYINL